MIINIFAGYGIPVKFAAGADPDAVMLPTKLGVRLVSWGDEAGWLLMLTETVRALNAHEAPRLLPVPADPVGHGRLAVALETLTARGLGIEHTGEPGWYAGGWVL